MCKSVYVFVFVQFKAEIIQTPEQAAARPTERDRQTEVPGPGPGWAFNLCSHCWFLVTIHVDLSFVTLVESLLLLPLLLLLLLLLELLEPLTAGLTGTLAALARIMLGLGRTPSGCRGPTGVDSIGSAAF